MYDWRKMHGLAAVAVALTLTGFPGCYSLDLIGEAESSEDTVEDGAYAETGADDEADAEADAEVDSHVDAEGDSDVCVPTTEECNGRDDDCDGVVDEGFGLGLPCDGPDADYCEDDEMTCHGCSAGPDAVEECDCIDNDCDGAVDEGCEDRICEVTLTVLEIDYPSYCWVDVPPEGSSDVVRYACVGSSVRFVFGDIAFTGAVTGCWIDVHARTTFPWSDGCAWETGQSIVGDLVPGGSLDYEYRESPLPGETGCATPCAATGTIRVE
jgi:hypothetical protein